MKITLRFTLSVFYLAIGLVWPCNVPAQSAELLSYSFNETGTMASAGGGLADAGGNPKLNLLGNGGGPADLHGAPGSGVSGLPSDRAFNNASSSGIIGAAHAQHAADFNGVDALNSLTLAGWFRLPSTATESIGRQAALIENGTISVLDSPGGFRLRGGATANSGSLELRVNRDFSVESSAAYKEINQWVFFAVSYDGASAANNVKFYKGTINGAVSLVDVRSLSAGPVGQESIPLTLGVTQSSGLTFGSFNGLLDEIRIFDSVESLASLEAVRLSNVSVPEPVAAVLVAAACGGLAMVRRRFGV